MGKYWLDQIESYLNDSGSSDITEPSEKIDPNAPDFIYGDLDGDKQITAFDLSIDYAVNIGVDYIFAAVIICNFLYKLVIFSYVTV